MNVMCSREDEGRWKTQECYDGVPRRPARRTSMETGRSVVGRWRSEGDMSGLFPPAAPCRDSPSHCRGPPRKQQLNRWSSRPNVLRSDSLPFQPGRRDSNITIDSDIDSSVLSVLSLGSSAMNSRCSNVSVSSMATPTFVAIPVQRLPLPVRSGGVEPIHRSFQANNIPTRILDRTRSSVSQQSTTTKTLVLKLSAEATRNRKLSRSRSNQSALQQIARAASERRQYHSDAECVTLPDDWMPDTASESGDTKCSDLFANMEAAADQQLKQLMACDVSETRASPRNDAAKVA